MFLLKIYIFFSVVTYGIYAFDKRAAIHNQWRIAEKQMHILSLVGGWPGAWIAQQTLRHKNRKASFQQMYWITVAGNIVGVMAIHAFY
jgi:uncharacterized membrane protein YsdA (DUF1294 family)